MPAVPWDDGDALDALADGVVIFDRDGTGPAGQPRRRAALRRRPRATSSGRPFADRFSLTNNDGRTWPEVNCPFEGPRIRTGVPEQSWVLPDGNECLVTARILRDKPLGPATGVALTVRSGRGRARLDRERSDLVAAVAHELRSPLTGVKGFVQAMLSRWGKLNDEQKLLMLTTVHADADRLSRLITELLDVARLDTGRLSLARRGADIRVLLGRIITSVQAGAPHAIELDAGPRPPRRLRRPRQVHDGRHQRRRERDPPRRRHGPRPRRGRGRATGSAPRASGSPSTTRARASRSTCAAGCSPSSGPGRATGAAPASASTSSTASPAPTAAQVAILDSPSGGARIVMDWPGEPPDLY